MARKFTENLIWVLFNNISLFVISLILNIVLARLLEPQDFGVVALAEVFLLLLNRVKELGFDYAMIHRQDRLEEVASVNFTLQFILGIFIMFLGVATSIVISQFYGGPVGVSLLLLTITAPIKGIISSYNSVLDKGFAFRKNAVFTVITNLIFAGFTVFLAWRGFSYLSLTLGLIPGILFNAFIFWRAAPFKLKFHWDKELVSWFFNFGPWWFWSIASFAGLIITNFDNFLIGTFLGTSVLGFYSRAYNFSSLVTDKIAFAFGRVLFPVYARFQNNEERLKEILLLQISLVPRLILPLVILGLLNIKELTISLLGERWLRIIPLIYGFFGFMIFKSFFDVLGYFFIAIGRPKICNRAIIVQAMTMLILEPWVLFFFHEQGLAVFAGLAWGFGSLLLFSNIGSFIKAAELLRVSLYSIIANSLTLAVTIFLSLAVSPKTDWQLLIFRVLIFAPVYAGLLLILERGRLIDDLKAFTLLEAGAKTA